MQFGMPASGPSSQVNIIKKQINNMNTGSGEMRSEGTTIVSYTLNNKKDQNKASYYTLSNEI